VTGSRCALLKREKADLPALGELRPASVIDATAAPALATMTKVINLLRITPLFFTM